MKKIYAILSLTLLAFTASFSQTQTYNGNGNSGFGMTGDGPIGGATLTINYDGTNLNFTLVTPFSTNNGGINLGNNFLVLYIDNNLGGGFDSTTLFSEQTSGTASAADAIASINGTNSSPLIFPTGFSPQYGLAIGGSNEGNTPNTLLVQLSEGGPFTTITSPTLTSPDHDSTTYNLSITPAQIGLSGVSFHFHFVGTLISNTAYRSNEAIGINFPTGTGNIAWTSYTDTTAPLLFSVGTFAVSLGDFNGVVKGNSTSLTWNTKSEVNTDKFNVQKSTDGAVWNTIDSVNAKNIVSGASYGYVDNNNITSKTYYRLQLVNKDGTESYSSVIVITKNGIHHIEVLGNPVTTGIINMNITDDGASTYHLSLYSADGKMLSTQVFNQSGGTSKVTMNVPPSAKGVNMLRISNGTTDETFRVVIQ